MSDRLPSVAVVVIALLVGGATAEAQVASSLLNEGDPFPAGGADHVVGGISNTAVNHVGGFAVSMNSAGASGTVSHIWGNASGGAGAVMRSEGTFGPLVQTSFESFYGMSDSGSLAYSASGNGGPVGGFDSVWKDDTPVAVEGDPVIEIPGQFWRFGSRPGITADGLPYFVGGITNTPGGTTQNRGLFFGMTAAPILLGGDVLPNLPAPLATSNTVSFDYRFSALASHYITETEFVGSSTANNAMVVDGVGLMLGGSLVAEGTLVPAGVGGIGGESWDNFDFAGHTESGDWFFSGDTDGAAGTDEIIVRNGMIVVREGDALGGGVIAGAIEGAYTNEDGDLAYIWDIDLVAENLEALFLNEELLLKEGDEVDLDGDGNVDPGAVVSGFTGISSLTLGDRDGQSQVNVYFTADIDTAGTSSTTDDIEGFYCMTVQLPTTAVEMPDSETPSPLGLRPVLRAAAPNPFPVQTSIGFSLGSAGPVRLAIYDVAGRLVDTIVDRQLSAGDHAFTWGRQSLRGPQSAGGVYFYRLEAGGAVLTRKMVMMPSD